MQDDGVDGILDFVGYAAGEASTGGHATRHFNLVFNLVHRFRVAHGEQRADRRASFLDEVERYLDAPAVGEGNASEPKFRAFSLSNAGHTDNHTDNIRACPTMFLVVRLRGKQRFCLGVLAKQGFNSPRLHVNGKNSSQNRKLTTG